MALRKDFELEAKGVDDRPSFVCISAPDKNDICAESTVNIAIVGQYYYKTSGFMVEANMTVKQAETLAMRVLEACASMRLAAREAGLRGFK